ncbi:MAG TPA: hypothetical protein VFF60_00850 [Candidatus Binatus sp.]|nr:hypothetical protein [Candidatus Binatus sp.]
MTATDTQTLTVVAATDLEARTVRSAAPGARVVEGGVNLARVNPSGLGDTVISCGLAGALSPHLPTGSVVIPDHVLRPEGTLLECDDGLIAALDAAARRLGYVPARGALVTTRDLVNGSARGAWAQRGYIAVDMETGFIQAKRIASVRVVLDTPERELSDAWLRPWTIFVRPDAWGQALWVAREAPRCARIAAAVLAETLNPTEP